MQLATQSNNSPFTIDETIVLAMKGDNQAGKELKKMLFMHNSNLSILNTNSLSGVSQLDLKDNFQIRLHQMMNTVPGIDALKKAATGISKIIHIDDSTNHNIESAMHKCEERNGLG